MLAILLSFFDDVASGGMGKRNPHRDDQKARADYLSVAGAEVLVLHMVQP